MRRASPHASDVGSPLGTRKEYERPSSSVGSSSIAAAFGGAGASGGGGAGAGREPIHNPPSASAATEPIKIEGARLPSRMRTSKRSSSYPGKRTFVWESCPHL